MAYTEDYPRDLVGYAGAPVDPKWPNDAKLAIQIVVNYEEGGETSVLHGDATSEAMLTEDPSVPFQGKRNISVESQYEYGSRAGFWRLHRMLTERNLPVTVFGVTMALARNPAAVAAMKAAGWEIASHGFKWINYAHMAEAEERAQIAESIRLHTEVVGEPPRGWYTGRMTENTRRLLLELGDFTYDSDSFADDLPYWTTETGTPHLIVPYALDSNDVRYLNSLGLQAPDLSTYLIRACDLLRREGETAPKMMSVGLHCRVAGRPGRAADLERFLDHIAGLEDVWVTRRIDIAEHWRQHHPFAG
ncbi:allantoinase PuuE [Arsenicitalea aurantiaca]|uniref:Chitooligosaccharide deacetylase n=1 Tax=Arsenicitalea aurantiaca TaxID=1783274 RepID=A0A433XKJ7_9HYPH|nr:allantoinase PuuE [Arsenicitalea aurantiaca]RUT34573.1 allantoinase PuuE [Arsenicitalea aurantiaca]